MAALKCPVKFVRGKPSEHLAGRASIEPVANVLGYVVNGTWTTKLICPSGGSCVNFMVRAMDYRPDLC